MYFPLVCPPPPLQLPTVSKASYVSMTTKKWAENMRNAFAVMYSPFSDGSAVRHDH